MMNKITFRAFFMCAIFSKDVSGVIIQRPSNMATNVGGKTVFNCSTDSTNDVTWLYTTDGDTARGTSLTVNNCVLNSNHTAHYNIEKTGANTCNLIVFDAVMSLGGCYACADGLGDGRLYQAMLVVVDSNAIITPNSTDLMPGEDVVISSSVSYTGPSIPLQPPPLPPSFYWTLQSNPNQNITSYPGLTSNTSASSYIIVTAQPPNVPPYISSLFFNAPVVVPTSGATNAPTYGTSWETTTYIVSYASENVKVSGQPDPCLAEPVELMCNASGYPTPTCKWYNFTSGVMLAETCTITIESGGSYQCIASNTIRDTIYNSSSTAVNVIDCKSYVYPQSLICENMGVSDPICITIIAIVAFFGLNLLFFTIFITCYVCSENGRNTMNDRFSWLKKMLPCVNDEGCKCSVWIFYFVILSIFAAFIFFPVIMIMASCCKTKKKTSQGNRQENERNVRGVGGTQLNTLGTGTTPYQYPPRVSVTSNPPSSLNTSANFQQDQTDRPYRHSSTQQQQPTYWGNSDPYPPNPRNLQLPRQTPSPALSSSGVVYAELGVDNQPKSRRPIQPIQTDANTYADIAIA